MTLNDLEWLNNILTTWSITRPLRQLSFLFQYRRPIRECKTKRQEMTASLDDVAIQWESLSWLMWKERDVPDGGNGTTAVGIVDDGSLLTCMQAWGRAGDERRRQWEAWPRWTAFPEDHSGCGAPAPLSDWRPHQAEVDITAVCVAAERATHGTPYLSNVSSSQRWTSDHCFHLYVTFCVVVRRLQTDDRLTLSDQLRWNEFAGFEQV